MLIWTASSKYFVCLINHDIKPENRQAKNYEQFKALKCPVKVYMASKYKRILIQLLKDIYWHICGHLKSVNYCERMNSWWDICMSPYT